MNSEIQNIKHKVCLIIKTTFSIFRLFIEGHASKAVSKWYCYLLDVLRHTEMTLLPFLKYIQFLNLIFVVFITLKPHSVNKCSGKIAAKCKMSMFLQTESLVLLEFDSVQRELFYKFPFWDYLKISTCIWSAFLNIVLNKYTYF